MRITKQLLSALLAMMASPSAWAQDIQENEEKKSLDSGTIKSQFEYVIEESNRYQEYKVVKMVWLDALKAHVSDSLKAVRKELIQTQNAVSQQKNDIAALQTNLKNVRDTLATVNNEKNSIDFINIQMKKSAYKSFMWLIIGVLASLLAFFIFKFNSSNMITTETKKELSEIQAEFEASKKRAREREQVLKRELQDELNKRL